MDRSTTTPPSVPTPRGRASQAHRDLALLLGAVAICAVTGVVAVAALLAGLEATWWTVVGLVAALAIGGCLAASRRKKTPCGLPTPGGVGYTSDDRTSDVA